ncbi:MAG: oligoribonuclease, partial [Pseudomonadales bacterium]
MTHAQDDSHLVWMDLEMTGLDPERHVIIEIATVVTDKELVIVAEGPVFAIHQDVERLRDMDQWNQSHHRDSGLVERVRASHVSEAQAEKETLAFVRRHVPPGV